jgi:hypothetical protein
VSAPANTGSPCQAVRQTLLSEDTSCGIATARPALVARPQPAGRTDNPARSCNSLLHHVPSANTVPPQTTAGWTACLGFFVPRSDRSSPIADLRSPI